MITTWVVFILMSFGPITSLNYETEKECLEAAARYKRAVCVAVDVPKEKR